jgi:hypothetical protein
MQYPRSSSAQTFMQGDRGAGSVIIELLGVLPYSSSLLLQIAALQNKFPAVSTIPRR